MDIQLVNHKESFNMDCKTFSHINEKGRKTYKHKKSFEAILECKILNAKPKQITKLVSYKCKGCHKYHIGRNGTMLTKKYKDKLEKELKLLFFSKSKRTDEKLKKMVANRTGNATDPDLPHAKFKVVGKIDLDKIPKK